MNFLVLPTLLKLPNIKADMNKVLNEDKTVFTNPPPVKTDS